ncbi:hypothetical protein Gasu2_48020 [Galdieria sulphuraria]|uniref:Uncharacterized protein n=1 Tax=Galdieria sulphuraria TaxID=130081 RepID=M2XAL3_GALSU|nr:uncharacterized protein Gasu_54840 [Galdieria sulphuraria]EME26912.1 hypothetical protein Gasu_54840 [Galdieria sulphuraria]GJD10622.1 hypothetical protein Gasu2_48020 [Galdieria sulphuraria]|eukprot:XP_005703432.1 hypothetical protein Gasu_54840 [Galdieria sulphuraria]
MLDSVGKAAQKLFDKTLGKRKVLESTKFFIYFAFPVGMVYFFGSGRYGLLDKFIEKHPYIVYPPEAPRIDHDQLRLELRELRRQKEQQSLRDENEANKPNLSSSLG